MSAQTGSNVEHILTEIQEPDKEGKTLLYEILEKRRIEESRDAIALRCDETMREYEGGRLKTGTPDDLFADLEDDV
jgi:hypothetical protein